jgi:hypothetical protein
MAAALVLTGLAFGAIVFFFAIAGLLLLKLVFRLVFFPLFLLKWIVMAVVMIVVAPILAVVGFVLTIVFGVLISIPLVPLLVAGAIVWMLLVSANRRPAAV